MRETLVKKLLEFASKDKNLMLITGDLGYSVFEPLMQNYPNNFLNCGIAEQNMIGMSAGFALSGKKVYAYSITPFATIRPLEQIRMDLCYHNLPVTVIGAGAGLSYGALGPSHHGTEDLSVMRSMPNMIVCAPADKYELAQILDASKNSKSPMYIRIGRSKEPDVHDVLPNLKISKALNVVDYGNDFAILACGNMVYNSVQVAKALQKHKKNGKVYSMHTLKPIDSALIISLGKKMPIFTCEEHSIIGGLASATSEVLMQNCVCPPIYYNFALADKFQSKVGTHNFLREINKLDVDSMVKTILKKLI